MGTVQDRYDEWHAARYREYRELTPTAPWHLMARRHIHARDIAEKRVLEVGCGLGQFSRWLHEQGAHVTASDFSPEACSITATVCGDAVDVVRLDAQDLVERLGRDSFDMVVCLETLEHVPDHDKALRELVGVTKPGGRIIISTPNYFSPLGLNRAVMRLFGKRFTEMGQPINNVLVGYARIWKLRRLGCRIDATEGAIHQWHLLGTERLFRFPWLERPAFKYVAQHVLVVATKN